MRIKLSFNVAVIFVLMILVLPIGNAKAATSPKYSALERNEFKMARKLIKQRKITKDQIPYLLKDYPLLPYLEYADLRNNLGRATSQDILEYVEKYSDSILAGYLKKAWLDYLAHKGQWGEFDRLFVDLSTDISVGKSLECYKTRSDFELGNNNAAINRAKSQWMVGYSQPKSCDKVFGFLYQSGNVSQKDVWNRIELAMDGNNYSLAKYLAKKLRSKSDKKRFDFWSRVYRNPKRELKRIRYSSIGTKEREIIVYGIKRLARKDAELANQYWQQFEARMAFTPAQKIGAKSKIALHAALQYKDNAVDLMREIPADKKDLNLREWSVRAALRKQDWKSVIDNINEMPKEEQQKSEWVYWNARALSQIGQRDEAIKKWGLLSQQRRYYGFLAADAIGKPYKMNHDAIDPKKVDMDLIYSNPAVVRASELRKVGMEKWARLEWEHASKKMTEKERHIAAAQALKWGWYDLAIRGANLAGADNDLTLRFPMAYRKEVERNGAKNQIDPAWVMGVLRKESAFRQDARSSVGALGLMQVMPATGRTVARKIRTPFRRSTELLDAKKNIRIGSAYLSMLLNRFDENMILATAAYNAGPGNVLKWLPEDSALPADIWVDTIPFKETRRYTQSVLSFSVVFGWRMTGQAPSLDDHMGKMVVSTQG